MTQYIDKSAVVAEINRVLNSYDPNEITSGRYELASLRSFLDSIEVKEVKEDPVSDNLEEAIAQSLIYHENNGDDFRSDKQIETAYRYGFETCAKWKEMKLQSTIELAGEQHLAAKNNRKGD